MGELTHDLHEPEPETRTAARLQGMLDGHPQQPAAPMFRHQATVGPNAEAEDITTAATQIHFMRLESHAPNGTESCLRQLPAAMLRVGVHPYVANVDRHEAVLDAADGPEVAQQLAGVELLQEEPGVHSLATCQCVRPPHWQDTQLREELAADGELPHMGPALGGHRWNQEDGTPNW